MGELVVVGIIGVFIILLAVVVYWFVMQIE